MRFLSRFFARSKTANITTVLERQRLDRTMPGQSGALAAARYGFVVR